MSPAMLRIRIQAAYEGGEVPDEENGFINLAARAGVSYKQRKLAWKEWASVRDEALTVDRLTAALAEAQSLKGTKPPRATALYRWFDDADLLLYIGISDELPGRTSDHIERSSWMEFAVKATIERHPSRKEALAAEKAAIKGEGPLFNDQHNRTPTMQLRLVEYLIERGRTDLLAPAVRRA
jgi:hypothetical protein